MKNVVNIVNFIRGWDGRVKFSLTEPVVEQVKLAEKYPNLPITFLYQYDALIQPEFVELTKDCKAETEIGIWIEMSSPLIEAVGLEWRGREGWEWDPYSCVDMTVGYTIEERKKIIDEIMRCFKEIYGYYPKTAGSWVLDAPSVQYMEEKYGIDAALICKEQWGTDGYSLWGGYYGSGYYPSKTNIMCPAHSADTQINVPVFRMLGCDPVDQYLSGLGTEWQKAKTLEPVDGCSGSDPAWVKWFLDETFKDVNHGVNYCQAGQENSFGWHNMKNGYTLQMEMFEEKRKAGEIEFETVAETGRKYKAQYAQTPCTTMDARKDTGSTLWYNSKFYRSNFYLHGRRLMLRDLYLFREEYKERYFDTTAPGMNCYLDTLPLADAFKWSTADNLGGGYFMKDGKAVDATADFKANTDVANTVVIDVPTADGNIRLTYREKSMEIEFPIPGYSLDMRTYKVAIPVHSFSDGKIHCTYEGFDYDIELRDATCEVSENGYRIIPNDKKAELIFE